MSRPSFRERLTVIVSGLAALVVINLLVLVAVNRPRLARAENADQTTATLDAQVERAEKQVDDLGAKVDRLESNKAALEKFFNEDLDSKRARLVAIQREIQKIAETFQVGLNQLKFDHEEVPGTNLIRFAVTIPLTGGYYNLRQFVQEVERSDIFLIIESVQLQQSERGGAMLNLNIRLTSYFIDDATIGNRFTVGG